MSAFNSLKRKFGQCAKDGFWLDKNTFIKSDYADIALAKLKGDKGKLIERPMIILREATILTVNHNRRIISVERKSIFGVWTHIAEPALERFNCPDRI